MIYPYSGILSCYDNNFIRAELQSIQQDVHKWGVSNRVIFDDAEEEFAILHRADPFGDTFRLLGVQIDTKLTMAEEVTRIRRKTKAKIRAILRTRHFYQIRNMLQQFKSHVWCILEFSAGSICHASKKYLDSLDKLQFDFLDELGICERVAFLDVNFPPLQLRGNIGILGVLQKIRLGEAHCDFQKILPFSDFDYSGVRTRHATRRHEWQFLEIAGRTDYFNNSIFGAVRIL